jgi:hypothetical protein
MLIRVYASTAHVARSLLRARLIAEVEVDQEPEDPQEFADQYGGDFIEVAPSEASDEESPAS